MNQRTDVFALVEKSGEKFTELAASHQAVKFKEECIFAKQSLEKNSFLKSVAERNPKSLETAIYNVAMAGITLNPVHQRAWLIPRDGEVCLDVGYRGLAWLAYQEDAIDWVQCYVVHKEDSFKPGLAGERPEHDYSPFKDRGELVGAYCVAKVGNDYLTHTIDQEVIEQAREMSPSYKAFKAGKIRSCPWENHFQEMVRKTCVKQAYKLWPRKSQRLDHAISSENHAQGITFEDQSTKETEAPPVDKGPSRTEISLEKEKIMNELLEMMGTVCDGMTMNEKAAFMHGNLGVMRFEDLKKKPLEALQDCANKIADIIEVNKMAGGLKV